MLRVCSVTQLCPTLWDSMDCRPPGSSAHGIFKARILKWIAICSSRECSWPRDWTCVSCIDRQILYHWATWEAQFMLLGVKLVQSLQRAVRMFQIYHYNVNIYSINNSTLSFFLRKYLEKYAKITERMFAVLFIIDKNCEASLSIQKWYKNVNMQSLKWKYQSIFTNLRKCSYVMWNNVQNRICSMILIFIYMIHIIHI